MVNMKILVVESPASRSREISEFIKKNNAVATRIDIKDHYDNIEEIQRLANELANAVVGADLVIAAYLEDIKDHADLIKKIIAGCAAIEGKSIVTIAGKLITGFRSQDFGAVVKKKSTTELIFIPKAGNSKSKLRRLEIAVGTILK